MAKLLPLLTMFLVLTFATQSSVGVPHKFICKKGATVNHMLDVMVRFMRLYIYDTVEPLSLPDFKVKRLTFYNGSMSGLSSLKRTGKAYIGCPEKKLIALSFQLGVENITMNYKWKGRVIFFNRRGNLKAAVHTGNMYMKIVQKVKHNSRPILKCLKIKLKGLKVKMTGHLLARGFIAVYSRTGMFRRLVTKKLEDGARPIIQKQLDKLKIPLDAFIK